MEERKKRILHVAQAAGGVDRYIRMLLKYLDKDKFENVLVCSQDFHEEDYKGLVICFEQIEMTRAIVILPGTIIGSNSIIGAGSVISGEIPEGVVVTSERELQFVRRRVNSNE